MTGDDRSESSRDEAAKQQRCPSCGTRDSIRYLGSSVTTLASVGITQMFGSQNVADDERKLLAFTDSVQDASHRAAFFSGRTHRFNLRATLSRALQERGRLNLTEIADVVLDAGGQRAAAGGRVVLAGPAGPAVGARSQRGLAATRNRRPQTRRALALAKRLGFDAILEAGLRSRFGRTLETTNTAIPEIVISDEEWERLLPFAKEAIQANTGQLITADDDVRTWIEGLLARLRLRGGIYHPFLDLYVEGARPALADLGRRRSARAEVPARDLGARVLQLRAVRGLRRDLRRADVGGELGSQDARNRRAPAPTRRCATCCTSWSSSACLNAATPPRASRVGICRGAHRLRRGRATTTRRPRFAATSARPDTTCRPAERRGGSGVRACGCAASGTTSAPPAPGDQLLPRAVPPGPDPPRRRRRAHRPADPRATRDGRDRVQDAAAARTHRTCSPPRPRWRWASTSATSRR